MNQYHQRIESWLDNLSEEALEKIIQDYLKSMRTGGRIHYLYLLNGFKNPYVKKDFDMFIFGHIIDESVNSKSFKT
ncbi:MAG: hypothetical protein KGL58_07580 [Pseudomonadota bacterium]|nr:hypothetical protein [Pseudomonadota bacterium]